MKLDQLSIADLIALRQELHERINACHKDRYLILAGKKKYGPNREELLQMADNYGRQFNRVKELLDQRLSLIEY